MDYSRLPGHILALQDAYLALKKEGWNDIAYAPKDGEEIEVLEIGSTGIHKARWHCFGGPDDRPNWARQGCFFIEDADDLWPSDPILFRRKP